MPPHDVSSVLWRLGSRGDAKILLLAAALHGECHRSLALALEPAHTLLPALIPRFKGAGIFGWNIWCIPLPYQVAVSSYFGIFGGKNFSVFI